MSDSDLYRFKNQQVRDLAWVIASPPVFNSITSQENISFCDEQFCENEFKDLLSALHRLDTNPAPLINYISKSNSRLLGKYFESLVEYWIHSSNRLELLAANVQVFEKSRTIGEFDFIVRMIETGKTIHIEAAGKFYLAYQNNPAWENFIGPNPADNMSRKMSKVFDYQVELIKNQNAKNQLIVNNIDLPENSKVLYKGYLFYHYDIFLLNNFVPPLESNPNHLKGWWLKIKEIAILSSKESKWIILKRQNWISRVFLPADSEVSTSDELINIIELYFEANTYPLLIAELSSEEEGHYKEISRGFIVSNNWPNHK